MKKFLNEMKILIAEPGTSWPSNWKDIPEKYKKDFKSWVKTYKQQTWEGNWNRAWEIYQLEYITFLINKRIEGLG